MQDRSVFINIIKNAPLISIDLIIENEEEILLGKRNNEPAKGYYFVPGGRILKDERIAAAFKRVAKNELNKDLRIEEANFQGVYEHLYDTNFLQMKNVTTHYIVLAYQIKIGYKEIVPHDSQHSEFIWMKSSRILKDKNVHQYTKAYFL